jgi:hypothetical protein
MTERTDRASGSVVELGDLVRVRGFVVRVVSLDYRAQTARVQLGRKQSVVDLEDIEVIR